MGVCFTYKVAGGHSGLILCLLLWYSCSILFEQSYDCRVSEVAVVGYSDIESREGITLTVALHEMECI